MNGGIINWEKMVLSRHDDVLVPVINVNTSFMVVLTVICLVGEIVAPIPPCSPFRYMNKVVESQEMAWLFGGLPGHPVAGNCPYASRFRAPLEEQSLLIYLLKNPNRITEEIRDGTTWFAEQGLKRINRRFWNNWDSSVQKENRY